MMEENKSIMNFEFSGKPDYSMVTIEIPKGQTLKVEASAMATMDTNISMKTKAKGGLGRFLTGESIFLNEFTAEGSSGEIGVVPPAPGDMEHIHLEGPHDVIYLQGSAFVASTQDVKVESKWQGMMKTFFSGESMFLIKCSGPGDVWFNSYGAIFPVEIDGEYVIDTGHIVGFTSGLDYQINSVPGFKSLFFSGEGLVCRFRGQGTAWVQTRKAMPFAVWCWPYRPAPPKNN
jgi:uncharacterized protein (TIGR00266 family)